MDKPEGAGVNAGSVFIMNACLCCLQKAEQWVAQIPHEWLERPVELWSDGMNLGTRHFSNREGERDDTDVLRSTAV